jgi:hypothetical protein
VWRVQDRDAAAVRCKGGQVAGDGGGRCKRRQQSAGSTPHLPHDAKARKANYMLPCACHAAAILASVGPREGG